MTYRADLLARPDLAEAARQFARVCEASREHSKAAAAALRMYGDHGPLISGCVRDHFPEEVKEHLRWLAKATADYSKLAHAARPPRVRTATMRELARAVATRDGAGYYGPQPARQ